MVVWTILYFLLMLLEPGISQGGRNYRPTPTKEPPTRELPGQGVVVGKEIMIYRAKCIAFFGIPFAQPPVGDLRFAPPVVPPKAWSGILSANKYASACMQSPEQFRDQDRLLLRLSPEIKFSEDCLYLNIFLPDGPPPPEGYPVMLWFHPGNLSVGATSLWDGSALAMGQKVVVVTAAYRLNIFGFLSTLDGVIPGNAGLMDQVAALDWVRDRISVFGGNPRNIVLCGHSGGGVSVGLHMLSPLSQGKFSKAIIMSAKGLITRSIKGSGLISMGLQGLTYNFGCDQGSKELVECLRGPSADYLVEHSKELFGYFGPVIDKVFATGDEAFLVDDPVSTIKDEKFAKVPVLTGYTDMEEVLDILEENQHANTGVSWGDYHMSITRTVDLDLENADINDTCIEGIGREHLITTAVFYYTPRPLNFDEAVLRERLIALLTEKYYGSGAYSLAAALNKVNTPAYVYRFDYKIKTDSFIRFPQNDSHLPGWVNAPHQFDLPFVWGMPYWTTLLKNMTWNSADKKMTDTILALWGNFVKFGNPTQSGVNLRWDVFKEDTAGVMILDRNSNMSDTVTFDYKSFEFWNEYYPGVYDVLLKSCNMSNSAVQIFVDSNNSQFNVFYICLTLIYVFLFVR